MSFGLHLTIDAYGGDFNKLSDVGNIYKFLEQLPKKINMTPISSPFIVNYDGGEVKEDWGYSGVIIIAESHISIHTFPEKQYFSADVFSCNTFDIEKTMKFLKQYFDVKKVEYHTIERGKNFPKTINF